MSTIELSDWEMLAVATLVRSAARNGTLHAEHGEALAEKLASAIMVKLIQQDVPS